MKPSFGRGWAQNPDEEVATEDSEKEINNQEFFFSFSEGLSGLEIPNDLWQMPKMAESGKEREMLTPLSCQPSFI
jgi:hypothetical protein